MEPTKPVGGAKPSKVEAIKLASEYLKTFVADEVDNGSSHFTEDAATVLKFHGSYQQDDRDVRTQLKKEGKEKAYQFMVRVRVVGGKLTADQYLACDHLARTVGNGTLRITTRQEFQLHGVLKDDLKSTIRAINESLLSTLAACGDVERNVLCCPAPLRDAVRDDLQRRRRALGLALRTAVVELLGHLARRREDRDRCPRPPSRRCRPPATTRSSRSTARPTCRASSRRPSPCPRTIAPISMPTTSVSWRSSRTGELVGYNVLVGGGLGTTPSAQKTFPFLARAALLRRSRRRAQDRRGGAQGLPRLRQPLRPQASPAQVHHPRLGHCRPSGPRSRSISATRWPIPEPVRVTEVDDHLGWHRAGGRQAVPGHSGRERPDQGRGRLSPGAAACGRSSRSTRRPAG